MPSLLTCCCRWPTEEGAGVTPYVIGVAPPCSSCWRCWSRCWPSARDASTPEHAPPSADEPDVVRARRRRVGVMGGTFDPIHHGHLVAASEVQAWFDLDEVVFVPTGEPWQKSERVGLAGRAPLPDDRVATASNPRFTVSRVDIDRGGPTYTIDTLRDLADGPARRRPLLHHRRRRAGRDLHLARRRRALRARPVRGLHPARLRDGPRARSTAIPSRPGHHPGDPGAGDLLHRVPRAPGQGRAGLVPRARRRGAVHRQARPLRPDDSRLHGDPHDRHRPRHRAGARRRPSRLGQAGREHPRLRRQRAAGDHRRVPALLGRQRAAGASRSSTRSRTSCARSAPSPYAARASATAAGC